METRNCKTCDSAIVGDYCPTCGQKHREGRITMRFISVELFHIITNLERGLWHTILGLVRNPGQVIRDYLRGATAMYYQPFRFLLLTTGLSALLASFVDFDKILDMALSSGGVQVTPEARELQSKMVHTLLRYTNLLISLSVPLFSVGTFLAYRKFRNTYAEHLVANAYLYGLLSVLSGLTIWFTTVPSLFIPLTAFSNFVTIFGNIWFYKSWYQIKWRTAIWRSLLGMFLMFIFIAIVGNVVIIVLAAMGLMPTLG